ncbi:MAG TPA: MBL fold metallo-hydrolase [Anaerolineales bacterium]|nr:MBL fold metallo-hydrolase [Anaerolineales bacterium]
MNSTFSALLVGTLAPLLALAQTPPAMVAPDVIPAALTALSAHVHAIPDNSVPMVSNIGFVVGRKAVLVIDTGLGLKNGAIVAATAARLAPGKPVYIVITHAHPEHDLGAGAFPASSKLIRSRDQQADLRDQAPITNRMIASRSPVFAALIDGVPFREADISFDNEYVLDLGGVKARIMAMGPNHTAGDTAVWIPGDRVLFAGDLAMKRQPVLMAPGVTIAHWLMTLDRIEKLQPTIVVPSHGPIGDTGLIQGYRSYLTEIRDRTTAAKGRGLDLDATTEEVAQAMLSRYPSRAQIANAVKVAFDEPRPPAPRT